MSRKPVRFSKPTVDIMGNIVHRYEGVTREQGDGVMASFGAPVALEDHAVRALLCSARHAGGDAHPRSRGAT